MGSSAAKKVVKKLLPPILVDAWRQAARAIAPSASAKSAPASQRDAEWYDEAFETHKHWRRHYTSSGYYFLWCVIVDRMQRADVRSVLDIGCGPGQFASLLRDRGLSRYCGVDFSSKRIDWARRVCPQYSFVEADAFQTDLFESFDHDTVVCNEFLEHVDRDRDVLRRIRAGIRVFATVPSFPFTSHVRHFDNPQQVADRYGELFEPFTVDEFVADESGRRYYLIEGVKR